MFDFEEAIRLKLRFDTPKGALSIEDLFDLPLTSASGKANLDDIAKGLFAKVRDGAAIVSFVEDTAPAQSLDQKRFDIVRYIIGVKKADNLKAQQAREKAEKRQKIMAHIVERQDADMKGKNLDELKTMLAELG